MNNDILNDTTATTVVDSSAMESPNTQLLTEIRDYVAFFVVFFIAIVVCYLLYKAVDNFISF